MWSFISAIFRAPRPLGLRREDSQPQGGAKQCSGLAGVQVFQTRERFRRLSSDFPFGLQVEHLPADHPDRTGAFRQLQTANRSGPRRVTFGENLKRTGKECIARQNR
jgi:hypothetical protein